LDKPTGNPPELARDNPASVPAMEERWIERKGDNGRAREGFTVYGEER